MTVVRIGVLDSETGALGLSYPGNFSFWGMVPGKLHGVRCIVLRPFRCFEGVHHRRSNVWMVRICLQFPDCIKSVQQFSQELPFSSGSSKLTRNREPICFASSDALRLRPIECRCGLLCPASCPAFRQGAKPSGCDYLNHWSSSFHAIQILESVQKLLLQTFGSLPADLFESPRGHPTDCSFIAIYMLKTSLISLDFIFRGKHPVLASGFSLFQRFPTVCPN